MTRVKIIKFFMLTVKVICTPLATVIVDTANITEITDKELHTNRTYKFLQRIT